MVAVNSPEPMSAIMPLFGVMLRPSVTPRQRSLACNPQAENHIFYNCRMLTKQWVERDN